MLALTADDVVTLSSSRIGPSAGLEASVARRAGECGRAAQLPAPEPYDARATLRGGRLTSVFDPSQDPRYASITSVVGCAPWSRVVCERRIPVREVVTTWNQAGRPVVRSRLTTLRRVVLPYPEG